MGEEDRRTQNHPGLFLYLHPVHPNNLCRGVRGHTIRRSLTLGCILFSERNTTSVLEQTS